MVTRIVKVYPLNSREYTDKSGQKKIFKSKAFIIHDGKSSYYVEAIQENAESIESLNAKEGDVVNVHVSCRAREFSTKDGEIKYANEITLTHMMKL